MAEFKATLSFRLKALNEEVARRKAAEELIKILSKDRGACLQLVNVFEEEEEDPENPDDSVDDDWDDDEEDDEDDWDDDDDIDDDEDDDDDHFEDDE